MSLQDIGTLSADLPVTPGLSLPCGFSKTGLPIGLQLLGPHFAEEQLLRAARMYEVATKWHAHRPPLVQ